MSGKLLHIACDLGAESGRVITGELVDGKVVLQEVHRFPNQPIPVPGGWRWNVPGLFAEILQGLAKSGAGPGSSVSVDSWGVDYCLCGRTEPLLGLPFQYRDPRTTEVYKQTREQAGLIFAETGIQMMQINTLYQLLSDLRDRPDQLGIAATFLTMADFFNHLLGAPRVIEESLASTTQMYHPGRRAWARQLLADLGLSEELFPEVKASGTLLGSLSKEVREATGLSEVSVVAGCSHDTAAAVAAVPAEGDDWAYLSSGTWSLIGVELDQPLMGSEVMQAGFTNEIGYGGSIRFLKNIVGLWILQECRREWAKLDGAELNYEELVALAGEAPPFQMFFDPDDPRFLQPGGMPGKIEEYCRETGQNPPGDRAAMVRSILESLALLYAENLDRIEELTGRQIQRLHIVGGGSRNALLNQLTADASRRVVLAGPSEATAMGNVLVQAAAMGRLPGQDLKAIREVSRNTVQPEKFLPSQDDFAEARNLFHTIRQRGQPR